MGDNNGKSPCFRPIVKSTHPKLSVPGAVRILGTTIHTLLSPASPAIDWLHGGAAGVGRCPLTWHANADRELFRICLPIAYMHTTGGGCCRMRVGA